MVKRAETLDFAKTVSDQWWPIGLVAMIPGISRSLKSISMRPYQGQKALLVI